MLINHKDAVGFAITDIATCDFEALEQVDHSELLRRFGRSTGSDRVSRFLVQEMGIERRHLCPPDKNALDLARDALGRLVRQCPRVLEDADFLILCGISNPMPVTTTSALLAGEFGFRNASCWDLKSGCSTGVLALIQAQGWMQAGARGGVIVCAETLSKFSDPDVLQMSASVGDGAVALFVERSQDWTLKSVVHGTDASLARSMIVNATFPPGPGEYRPEDYYFTFNQKPEGIEAIGRYWVSSLRQLLENAGISGADVQHYFAHQVDAKKNAAVAEACGLRREAVATNFSDFGNMGCPTVFINYHRWQQKRGAGGADFAPGAPLVFHAVGGGVSWAGLCLVRR